MSMGKNVYYELLHIQDVINIFKLLVMDYTLFQYIIHVHFC